jgi:hypothetical protein
MGTELGTTNLLLGIMAAVSILEALVSSAPASPDFSPTSG